MIAMVTATRAPQTVLSLGGLQIPSPQNIKDIRTLTLEGIMIPVDTFIPYKFEGNNYIVPAGKLTLIGQALSVAGKDAFQLGDAADILGNDFIPIIGAQIFSKGSMEMGVLDLLTPVKENRIIGCFSVNANMSIASTLYCQEIFDSTLTNQPVELIP